MRVAHLVGTYLPLTETFIYNQLVRLRATAGVVLAGRIENLDQFPVSIPVLLRPPALLAPPMARAVRRLSRRIGWIAGLVRQPADPLVAALDDAGVSLVHAHFGPEGCTALEASRVLGLPLVTSFYGYDASSLARERRWRRAYRRLFAAGARFVVEGPAMRDRLSALGCPQAKISIVPIGIDVSGYPYRERSMDAGRRPVRFVVVGRFVEKKGIEMAVRAIARVRRAGVEVMLDIVGDGPLRDRILEAVRAESLGDHVRFMGALAHRSLVEVLDSADILLAPSLTAADGDCEGGAPTILIEAQACGLPVVSTLHADIPFVTVPGRSAMLCGEGDLPGYSRLVMELCRQPQRWGSMGRAGRQFVVEHHGIDSTHAALLRVYSAAVSAIARAGQPFVE